MWSHRPALNSTTSNHSAIDAAIVAALAAESPTCLLDMGDNVGGGAPGDGVWLAGALHARRIANSLVTICDKNAAERANAAGVGSQTKLSIGAKSGPASGTPLCGSFTVHRICDGRFHESAATHGGFTDFDQGLSAVVTTDYGLSILVTSRRMVPFSLVQLTSCGIDPAKLRIIVAKGVNAPIAAYSKVCRTFIRVDTPGPTTANMTKLTYTSRRRPMFPFESDCDWRAS
jgi:microcystin degradation protein MlrC